MDIINGKPNIAIVAGGYSSEYEISLQSGKQIQKWIDKNKYNVFFVVINKKEWICYHNDRKVKIDKSDFSVKINQNKIIFDFVIIAIHGHPGENGILQSYFDLLNIKYSTSSAQVSFITFDKFLSKTYLEKFEIKTAKALLLTKHTPIKTKTIIKQLGLPLIVKPNASGSSFGISLVKNEDELIPAIKKAFEEDKNKILIEEYLNGTEVSCGVFFDGNQIITFPPTEIISKTEFFDYEAKYLGKSEEITPARLEKNILENIQSHSKKIYEAFMCEGIVRIDFIIKNNTLYFLEVNTVPGMSEESIFPKQAKVKGIEMSYIYEKLIASKLKV